MNGVKLNKEKGNVINVLDMQDGQIAEIVFSTLNSHIGRIVQRCGYHLIAIGYKSGYLCYNLFDSKQPFRS